MNRTISIGLFLVVAGMATAAYPDALSVQILPGETVLQGKS